MEFCKQFNAKSKDAEPGAPIPVKITVFSDRSFTFEMRTPPASYLLKKISKVAGGSKEPGRTSAGTVTMAQVREVAKQKMKDMNTDNLEQAARTVAGTARSMGIQVVE
jgi:large subunit ribosomal protein L11